MKVTIYTLPSRGIYIVRHWVFREKTGVYASFVYGFELVYPCYSQTFVFLWPIC